MVTFGVGPFTAMSGSDPAVFDVDWANAIWDYVHDADRRVKAAEQRNAELIRAHQIGWKGLADAVHAGLADIADAIRAHNG